MTDVEEYILNLDGEQQKIFQFLHNWLEKELGLTSKIRYKVPFYFRKSWICYLNPKGKEKMEMAFLRGNELSNEQKLLDFKDRVQVAGIDFEKVADIPLDLLYEIVQEAILLDEIKPYKLKRK